MFPKLIITFGVILYALVVPILEISATHVFNPGQAPHMRIHEVCRMVGIVCMKKTLKKNEL